MIHMNSLYSPFEAQVLVGFLLFVNVNGWKRRWLMIIYNPTKGLAVESDGLKEQVCILVTHPDFFIAKVWLWQLQLSKTKQFMPNHFCFTFNIDLLISKLPEKGGQMDYDPFLVTFIWYISELWPWGDRNLNCTAHQILFHWICLFFRKTLHWNFHFNKARRGHLFDHP